MRFHQEFIDKVVEANNIVDVISQYTNLKNSGSNLMGLCPFPEHKEKTPSFSVSPNKQLFHCFGCKKGGNVIHFLQEYNGYTFPEAIEYLANLASISLPKEEFSSKEIDQERKIKKSLEKTLKLSFDFFRENFQTLDSSHPAKVYLKKRGLSQEIIEKFQISYAPDAWESLVQFFSKKSVPMNYATQVGLVKKKNQGSGYYDIFRKRILFPILSPMGQVLGYGGRVLSKEDQPKYLNSPDSPIFHKGDLLYGLHETSKFIRNEDQAILVEGYMDLVSLYQVGIKNIVANLGTALTNRQARLLKKYTKNIVVLFDGDSAGQMAMRRSLPILLQEGLFPKGFSLPEGKDPDDYLKEVGLEGLKKEVDKAEDLFLWFLQDCLKSFHGKPAEKVQILDSLLPILAEIQDLRLQKLYISEISYRLDVDSSWVEKAFYSFQHGKRGENKSRIHSQATEITKEKKNQGGAPLNLDIKSMKSEEIEILNLILAQEALLKKSLELNLQGNLVSNAARSIFAKIQQEYRQNSNEFAKLGNSLLQQFGHLDVLTKHLNTPLYENEEKNQKLFELCMQKLKKVQMKERLNEIKTEMKLNTSKDSLQNLRDIIEASKSKSHEEISE